MKRIFPRRHVYRFLARLSPLCREKPGLVESVADAKRAWKQALDYMNYIEHNYVDYAVHNINASERRYIALLQEARREGVTAWPAALQRPVLHGEPASAAPARNSNQEAVNH